MLLELQRSNNVVMKSYMLPVPNEAVADDKGKGIMAFLCSVQQNNEVHVDRSYTK